MSTGRILPRHAVLVIVLFLSLVGCFRLSAHHFKGLPHYNYFENYPQIPEEEFLGQAGQYEFSLVVYDFQGINKEQVPDPDKVRLFLVIFNLRNNKVYQGALTMQIMDRDQPVHQKEFKSAELENIYSIHRELPGSGRYSLRITLHEEGNLACNIPFRLSNQKIHWGRWIASGLILIIGVAAVGARKARINQDRREAARNTPPRKEALNHA